MDPIRKAMQSLVAGAQRRDVRRTLTFEEFLTQLRERPACLIRNVHQLFHDMVRAHVGDGHDEYPDDPESISFIAYDFDTLLVDGADQPFHADRILANRLMNLIEGFRGGAPQNKIYVFNGPPGSGKSIFLNNLLRKFEAYCNSPAGCRYETVWHIDREALGGDLSADPTEQLANLLGEQKTSRLLRDLAAGRRQRARHGYVEVPCPSHDNPILMIPREQRAESSTSSSATTSSSGTCRRARSTTGSSARSHAPSAARSTDALLRTPGRSGRGLQHDPCPPLPVQPAPGRGGHGVQPRRSFTAPERPHQHGAAAADQRPAAGQPGRPLPLLPLRAHQQRRLRPHGPQGLQQGSAARAAQHHLRRRAQGRGARGARGLAVPGRDEPRGRQEHPRLPVAEGPHRVHQHQLRAGQQHRGGHLREQFRPPHPRGVPAARAGELRPRHHLQPAVREVAGHARLDRGPAQVPPLLRRRPAAPEDDHLHGVHPQLARRGGPPELHGPPAAQDHRRGRERGAQGVQRPRRHRRLPGPLQPGGPRPPADHHGHGGPLLHQGAARSSARSCPRASSTPCATSTTTRPCRK